LPSPSTVGTMDASSVALTVQHFAADVSLRGSAAEVGIRMPLRGERGLEVVRGNVGHPAMQDPQRQERRKATRGLRTICWGSSKTLPQAPFCAETRRGPGHGGCGVVGHDCGLHVLARLRDPQQVRSRRAAQSGLRELVETPGPGPVAESGIPVADTRYYVLRTADPTWRLVPSAMRQARASLR
jgi:hypothetical protein